MTWPRQATRVASIGDSAHDPAGTPSTQHGPNGAATGREYSNGTAAAEREPSPDGKVTARLTRLSALHAEMAEIYRDLAGMQLDGSGRRLLMDGMEQSRVHDARAVEPGREALLSVRDVSARLQVDQKTVRRWRKEGKLPPAVTIAGVVRWRPEAIESWLEGQVR